MSSQTFGVLFIFHFKDIPLPTPHTPGVIGITPTFYADPDSTDGLGIQRTQELPDHYWAGLQWARDEQVKGRRSREFHKVADIPAVFVELWLRRDGFDAMKEDAKSIVKKLYAENLSDFVTTSKRVI